MKTLEIDIPVYNEERDLPKNIPLIYDFCKENLKNYDWKIVIINNGSTDKTWEEAGKICDNYGQKVARLNLNRKGRGWALRSAWKLSAADYVSYMDIDLSSDINQFLKMIYMLDAGHDLITGTRNRKESQVIGRTFSREIISKSYIALVKIIHKISLSDTQCGFKAVRRGSFLKIESLLENNLWFFDSEMIIIMEKSGFKLGEVPIKWVEDRNSTVKVLKDSWEEFSGLVRLRIKKPWKKIKH